MATGYRRYRTRSDLKSSTELRNFNHHHSTSTVLHCVSLMSLIVDEHHQQANSIKDGSCIALASRRIHLRTRPPTEGGRLLVYRPPQHQTKGIISRGSMRADTLLTTIMLHRQASPYHDSNFTLSVVARATCFSHISMFSWIVSFRGRHPGKAWHHAV